MLSVELENGGICIFFFLLFFFFSRFPPISSETLSAERLLMIGYPKGRAFGFCLAGVLGSPLEVAGGGKRFRKVCKGWIGWMGLGLLFPPRKSQPRTKKSLSSREETHAQQRFSMVASG